MNQWQVPIVGNLTGDPELRYTPEGVAVCAFTVAHNPRHKNAAGEWVDGEPTFVRCTAWRALAENIAETVTSGARVVAIGNLQTRTWEADGRGKAPKGAKLSRLEMTAYVVGAELSFATAKVEKKRRGSGPADDPWDSFSTTRPAGAATAPDDEPPF